MNKLQLVSVSQTIRAHVCRWSAHTLCALLQDEVEIFFSAHGVPVSYVEEAGDPYKEEMEQCISLIMRELQRRSISNHHTLAYQSRVGPVEWLQPYTDVTIRYGLSACKCIRLSGCQLQALGEAGGKFKYEGAPGQEEGWGLAILFCSFTRMPSSGMLVAYQHANASACQV